MECPKCRSDRYRKDGRIKERQRYLCKECQYHYTVKQRAGTGDAATRRQALQLYLEGLGFRAIGRLLKFSNVTILRWIRTYGEELVRVRNDKPVQMIEMDEMHTYIGSKKTVAGYGLLLIVMEKDSSTASWVAGVL